MRLRQDRPDRVANPGGRIVRRNDNTDVHADSLHIPGLRWRLRFALVRDLHQSCRASSVSGSSATSHASLPPRYQ